MIDYEKKRKFDNRKELWGGILGVLFVIGAILLGIEMIIAPLTIVAYVLYMIFKKKSG